MKLNDAVFGFILFALGGAVLLGIQGYPRIPGQPVGPALFPGLIAAGLCACGVLLVLKGLRSRATQPWLVWEDWVRSPRHILGLLLLLGSIVFYILASNWLGFLPTAFAILLAMFLVLRVPPGRAVVVALVATLLVHFAFYKLLRVPLPWGVLQGVAW
ncbi:MAG: tripartite tricarboxylate transporter TctB family protein [Comamonadaceae bacterium]|nr:MAG: tripartite tricarboxylate transporter TctB family protein [Comamonadaceae bacterium]